MENGLIVRFNGCVSSIDMPREDCGIAWEYVSQGFKKRFMETWRAACRILEQKHNTNIGMNIIVQLEKVAKLVNEGKVTKADSFDAVYAESLINTWCN
ncbi:hypothetical protein J2S74_002903 [Evansella vedderi]|uniref:Uncharacterized protein n=1 Tax=Evansella vedderi TaxID=38282 RepID=A0ABT9ZXS0_9BACI|nr:hypothetical protein [Evansella vedderi]MDQ0255521.1 hypothetical protein [Evansella vedderi]